jgi:acetyltransferase-like isoleucine patch superfamily enzyme
MSTILSIGQSASFSKTITESDVYTFAGVVGDFNALHVNEEEAKKGIFGKRVAHGMIAGGLVSTVLGTKLPGAGTIYLEQDLKFTSPIYIEDTLTATVTVSEVINPGKGIYKLSTDVNNQNGNKVAEGYAVVKFQPGENRTIVKNSKSNISPKAQIATTAVIHDGVTIEDDAIIHDFVVLYPGTVIKAGAEIYDHCTIGKYPTTPGSTARTYEAEYGKTVIGEHSILCPGVTIYTNTEIGHNTLLGDSCSIREQCKIGDYDIISRNVSVNYETVIGSHTKIMDNSHITGNMTIGDHVFISVMVSSTNDNSMGRDANAVENIAGPVVDDYVTIGASAALLPGVHIGKNAIVGASALVTKDVPENKVVMGVPAKVVRDVDSE